MEHNNNNCNQPETIAIVGAGFSGTVVTAMLQQLAARPLNVILFDKTGHYGAGDAYNTPYPYHILNVRACDMSYSDSAPGHFVDWLKANPQHHQFLNQDAVIEQQYVPRMLYHYYLKEMLQKMRDHTTSAMQLQLIPAEVMHIQMEQDSATLMTKDGQHIKANKVVLALGNLPPAEFPFSVSANVHCIDSSWQYKEVEQIDSHANVLIVGMGLSMIDAVLTLYHRGHQGKIHAVSRHGMLPLPHANVAEPYRCQPESLPHDIRALTKKLREASKTFMQAGGDWRALINDLRQYLPMLWENSSSTDKKRFMRHVMPYWNIHRHRVHHQLTDILAELIRRDQLTLTAGRVVEVASGYAVIKPRKQSLQVKIKTDCIINCMGPSTNAFAQQPLIQSLINQQAVALDELGLGLNTNSHGAVKSPTGNVSEKIYALGPATRGVAWECTAVPEIRRQAARLVQELIRN